MKVGLKNWLNFELQVSELWFGKELADIVESVDCSRMSYSSCQCFSPVSEVWVQELNTGITADDEYMNIVILLLVFLPFSLCPTKYFTWCIRCYSYLFNIIFPQNSLILWFPVTEALCTCMVSWSKHLYAVDSYTVMMLLVHCVLCLYNICIFY